LNKKERKRGEKKGREKKGKRGKKKGKKGFHEFDEMTTNPLAVYSSQRITKFQLHADGGAKYRLLHPELNF
jgi:hypothetical protein